MYGNTPTFTTSDTSTEPPPSTSKPSTSHPSSFFKTVLIPLLLALFLYLLVFHALLPLYRRHRQRYSQYLPLPLQSTSNLTSHLPTALQPATLREHISNLLVRAFMPSTWALRNRREDVIDVADDALFDEDSGERMVGFDVQDRRRDAMDGAALQARQANAARDDQTANDTADSSRRLSRELEEGFKDDSGSDREDEEVTVGRARMGRSAWDRLRTGYT